MRILVRKRIIRTDNGKMLLNLIIKFAVLILSELCIYETAQFANALLKIFSLAVQLKILQSHSMITDLYPMLS